MRALLKPFLERFVIPVCAGPITWAVTAKLQLGLRYQIAVIAFGVLAGLFASFAIADEKTGDPSPDSAGRGRRAFTAYLLLTLSCIALGLISGYLGAPSRRAIPDTKSVTPDHPPVQQDDSSGSVGSNSGPKALPASVVQSSTPVPQATAARELDDFIQRYVDTGLAHRTDKPQWAFVISDRNHSDFPELGAAMAETITEVGYRNVALFRPALVRDGKLEDLYSADPVILRRLGQFCDGLIVAVVDQTPVPNTGMQDVLTVEIAVRVRIIATPSGTVKNEFSVLERGAGFTTNEAERNARQRGAQDLQRQLRASF